jgi:hypothetical protein
LRGTPHHDYRRHRRALEPIFTDIFPGWNPKTGKLRVEEIAKLPIHLILDLYSAHRAEANRTCAAELQIVLHFIPAGWTDELQPLDRDVFGALKRICRRLFASHCDAAEDVAVARSDAVKFLLQAWSDLEVAVIEKGWGISEDERGDTANADDEEDPPWAEE